MKCAVFAALFFLIGTGTCCPLDCGQVQCAQDYDPFSCPKGTVYSRNAAICGCCPGCVRFRGPGQPCRDDTIAKFNVTQYFVPRTKAVCSQYVYDCTSANNGNANWSPACDIDGSYEAVQCKEYGAEPRCFCYDKEGKRIFGFDWAENKDQMKCLCSRLVAELMSQPHNRDLTFHCSANGNFEKLQCNRGMCYCADQYTGQPISNFVPENLWNVLPCYDDKTMGAAYLRKCDSQSNALGLILKELSSHGGNPITLQSAPCDPDGSYAPKQCDNSQCFCRSRDNEPIGAYSTELGTAGEESQYCYCARDKVIFAEAGRPHSYSCDGGGNYKPKQTIGDNTFCVDGDGFETGNDPDDGGC